MPNITRERIKKDFIGLLICGGKLEVRKGCPKIQRNTMPGLLAEVRSGTTFAPILSQDGSKL
jgi:hypothetical protein